MSTSVLCIVGARIGPSCLASVLESGGIDRVTVAATPKCDVVELRRVLDAFEDRNLIVEELAVVLGDVSLGRSNFDWLLNLWGEVILPAEVLRKVGDSVNIHPAMLPYGRGSDPAIWTLRNHWPAGVSLHRITVEVDAGPVWAQREVKVAFPCRGVELYEMLLKECRHLFAHEWPAIRDGRRIAVDQLNTTLPTHRRRQMLADHVLELIDTEHMSARSILEWLLAYDFGSDFSAVLRHEGRAYRARLILEHFES